MKQYSNLDALLAKIEEQQRGKEGTPAYSIGEQLKEIARNEPESAELLDADLDKKEMDLISAAKNFQSYADQNRKKSRVFCITPAVADGLLRKFYGLPERGTEVKKPEKSGFLDLESFL